MCPQWLVNARITPGSRYVDTVAAAFIELIRGTYENRLRDCVRAEEATQEHDRP